MQAEYLKRRFEVKGYDKQTVNIEYNVSGQLGTAPYIEYMEWRRLKGKKGD